MTGCSANAWRKPLPVAGVYGPDADFNVVRPFAAALHLGFDPAVLDVNGKDLSPAGVGTATAEPCADAELFKGLPSSAWPTSWSRSRLDVTRP